MSESPDGTETPAVDLAGPADGRPIVFIHGAVFTRKMWAPQRDALDDEFRVVAPDLPGHGARLAVDFRMEAALDVVDDIVENETDGDALLVGLSLGGYTATAYAARHPENIGGLVVSGASANPVGRLKAATLAIAKVARVATKSGRVENRLRKRAAEWVRERDLPADQTAEILDAGFYPRQFGVAGPELAGTDFRGLLADYPGPSLVLNGEDDDLMRRGEEEHAAAASDGRVEVVSDAGHVCNLERPSAYTDAIRRFCTETVASATTTE